MLLNLIYSQKHFFAKYCLHNLLVPQNFFKWLKYFIFLGEFYNQGDIEKTMGLLPLSMMDREKQYMVPEDQVQFLTVVVKPCTELLKLLLANTEELYDECE